MDKRLPATGASDAVVQLNGEALSTVETLTLSFLVAPALQTMMTTSRPTATIAAAAAWSWLRLRRRLVMRMRMMLCL